MLHVPVKRSRHITLGQQSGTVGSARLASQDIPGKPVSIVGLPKTGAAGIIADRTRIARIVLATGRTRIAGSAAQSATATAATATTTSAAATAAATAGRKACRRLKTGTAGIIADRTRIARIVLATGRTRIAGSAAQSATATAATATTTSAAATAAATAGRKACRRLKTGTAGIIADRARIARIVLATGRTRIAGSAAQSAAATATTTSAAATAAGRKACRRLKTGTAGIIADRARIARIVLATGRTRIAGSAAQSAAAAATTTSAAATAAATASASGGQTRLGICHGFGILKGHGVGLGSRLALAGARRRIECHDTSKTDDRRYHGGRQQFPSQFAHGA